MTNRGVEKERAYYRSISNSNTIFVCSIDIHIIITNCHITESFASRSAQRGEQLFSPIFSQLQIGKELHIVHTYPVTPEQEKSTLKTKRII